jgi:hypothetical protein
MGSRGRESSAPQELARLDERQALEAALADAEAKAGQPWRERVEGARRAAADVEKERGAFITANLAELIEDREEAGRALVEQFNRHLEALVADYAEWNRVAQQITGLASTVGPLRPGDVNRTGAEQVMREVKALLHAGEEQPPRLLHRPGEPRFTHLAETSA